MGEAKQKIEPEEWSLDIYNYRPIRAAHPR
jgi:hypothetical protein